MMNLIEEFTITAQLEVPVSIGSVPTGERVYYGISGGEVIGNRVNGTVLGGGEWALIGPDGYLGVDVRLQVETRDGAHLYMQYFGHLEMNEAVQTAIASGTGTEYEDQYFYTNPRVETGDERYTWMNRTFFIGRGRILPGAKIGYSVWRPQ